MIEYSLGTAGIALVWISPLLIIALILYIVNKRTKALLSPREMLQKRYADGEIDKQEYEEALNALED